MMYIDAVCKGIDDIPTVTPEIRDALYMQFETEGLAPILAELKEADPVHYEEVDRNNYKRVDPCRRDLPDDRQAFTLLPHEH